MLIVARVCEKHGEVHSRRYIAFYNACRYLLAEHQPKKHLLAGARLENDGEKFISACIDYTLRYAREIEALF